MSRLWAPGLLLALLIGQLVFSQWQRGPLPLTGPITGEVLPATQVELLDGGGERKLTDVLTSEGTCSLLVVVSTGCPISQRMRVTWRRRLHQWSDSIGAPVRALWLSGEDTRALRAFYEGYDLRGVGLARITSDPQAALRLLGVYATPTTYLIDRTGRLRIGVAGDQLPPASSARAFCK